MAFAHARLEDSVLGTAVLRVIGESAPDAMRAMVARGLAPLPPRDLVVALYQLWVSGEPTLAEQASKTVEGLPPPVVLGAVGDPGLPSGVLDLLGRKLIRQEELLDKVVRHVNVDDQTLVGVARICAASVCETIATNQTRWLRAPDIVVSLYNNKNCRMSVVHTMLELAEREGVQVRLSCMEEIRAAMADELVDEARDAVFASAMQSVEAEVVEFDQGIELELPTTPDTDFNEIAEEPAAPIEDLVEAGSEETGVETDVPAEDEELAINDAPVSREHRLSELMAMRPMEKIRAALLGDRYDRSVLVRDANKLVSMATIKSPKVREDEAVAYAANRALPYEVIRYIANRRDWVKLYTVKLHLVMNPKTPLSRAMSLLAFLNGNDIRKVARSKNIPAPLAKAAQQKLRTRR